MGPQGQLQPRPGSIIPSTEAPKINQKIGNMERILNTLADQVNVIHLQLDELTTRLACVLFPVASDDIAKDCQKMPVSPMAAFLSDEIARLESANGRIRQLINSLEL